MSAPDTNIDKQTRRHRPSLWAIAAVVTFVAIAAAIALTRETPLVEDQAAPSMEAAPVTQ